ncbi:MAG: MlaD family protein [Candidatus Omnitrophica bacterium]|nr:MlaD family protein [Candidatus Omnitrophota bacterium]
MEKKLSLEVRVGIFVLCALIAVIGFIFTQTKFGKLKGYEIGVLFDSVGGLEIGSPVRISGVRAGEVKKIEILYEEKPKVFVKLKLSPYVKVGKNSRITIKTLGIIGEKYVEITPTGEKEFIKPGEIINGETPFSYEKIANVGEEIAYNLNKILFDISKITGDIKFQQDIKEILSNSKTAISKLNASLDKIENLVGEISETNKSLKTFIVENSPHIKKVIIDTDEFLVSGKKELEATLGNIRDFLTIKDRADEILVSFSDAAREFQNTSLQIKNFFGKLESKGLIAKIMEEEKMLEEIKKEIELLQETTLKIGIASEKLSYTLENINSAIDIAKKGKGSVGKFLYSDELYNEVMDFVKDIKAHPWKLFMRRK